MKRILVSAVVILGLLHNAALAQDETVKLTPQKDTATAIQQEAPEDKDQAEINVGRVDFSDPAKSDKARATLVKIGKRTNSQMKIYRDQVLGKEVINVDTRLQVGGTEKVYVAYYAVFQNTAGSVIGAAGTTDEVEPGVDFGWTNGLVIPLPLKRFGEIAYYQIVLYESNKPIGTLPDDVGDESKNAEEDTVADVSVTTEDSDATDSEEEE